MKGSPDAPPDVLTSDGGPGGIALHCSMSGSPALPNPCPTSRTAGEASFCYRPQWSGVTSVEVYGGFKQENDWAAPFLILKDDGSGTFTGTAQLADGTYPYIFKTTGSADNLVTPNHTFLDQYNTDFILAPPQAPDQRSVSLLTIPQPAAAAVVHLKGTVVFNGAPQSCYSVDLEAGEVDANGKVVSEHDTANYTESASDGTFDFPVAVGAPYGVTIRFPFLLSGKDAGYPDPFDTPSVGTTRTGVTLTPTGDLTLPPANVAYPTSNYTAMSPTSGTASLPVTFKITLLPGSGATRASVTSTNVAGNDPAYASEFDTTTTVVWDGGFNGASGNAVIGTTYYWGAWQRFNPVVDGGPMWTEQSLLFPITFH